MHNKHNSHPLLMQRKEEKYLLYLQYQYQSRCFFYIILIGDEAPATAEEGGEVSAIRPVSVANQTQCCGKLKGKSGVCSVL